MRARVREMNAEDRLRYSYYYCKAWKYGAKKRHSGFGVVGER